MKDDFDKWEQRAKENTDNIMSKEQTPITAEELFSEIWGIIDLEQREKVKLKAGTILDIEQVIEQYAQAKVLEALERDRKQFGDFLLNRRSEELSRGVVNFMRPVTCRDIEYYETEVKPKYKL